MSYCKVSDLVVNKFSGDLLGRDIFLWTWSNRSSLAVSILEVEAQLSMELIR